MPDPKFIHMGMYIDAGVPEDVVRARIEDKLHDMVDNFMVQWEHPKNAEMVAELLAQKGNIRMSLDVSRGGQPDVT